MTSVRRISRRVHAWAPGHATFFFAVPKRYDDPMAMGSLGGGLNFDAGVRTSLKIGQETTVRWNQEIIDGAVTRTAIDLFKEETSLKFDVQVDHYSELPIGYGLSTSGAGAIGTILALNQFFASNLSKLRCYQLAHIADVMNHTGLGSVIGQITSGIELRLSQGGPGVGKTKTFDADDPIILLFMGPLSTSDVITSEKQMITVTDAGKTALNQIKNQEHEILEKMFAIGHEFTQKCGLSTRRIDEIQNQLNDIGEKQMVMAQIGETLVIRPHNARNVLNWARRHRLKSCHTRITTEVPHVIKN